jgi:hypothetical protein
VPQFNDDDYYFQYGGIADSYSTIMGQTFSGNSLTNGLVTAEMAANMAPSDGVKGNALSVSTSFGDSAVNDSNGIAESESGSDGQAMTTSTQFGGATGNDMMAAVFGDAFGDFTSGTAAAASFGLPFFNSNPIETGASGRGASLTNAGGIGSVSGDAGMSEAKGDASARSFSTGEGVNPFFGNAGGRGGASSVASGGGDAASLLFGTDEAVNGIIGFNGTGGGLAKGDFSGFVGFPTMFLGMP